MRSVSGCTTPSSRIDAASSSRVVSSNERMNDEGNYQIIAGERRWRAARKAGLTSVPAYVRTVSDSEMTEMALIENIQREDLNAIEVALGFKKLIDSYNRITVSNTIFPKCPRNSS